MRFLVSGASGFIGAPLMHALAHQYGIDAVQGIIPPTPFHPQEEARLSSLRSAGFNLVECDLLQGDLNKNAIIPFDILFHLAGCGETELKTSEIRVNDSGTERFVTELGELLLGKRVIFTSTIASVDRHDRDETPMDEEYPCNPRTEYGRSKLAAENYLKSAANQYGYSLTVVRLPTVYGPGFRVNGMFEVIARSLKTQSFKTRLNWPGKSTLLYIQDLTKILVQISQISDTKDSLYHLGAPNPLTFDEIIDQIATELAVPRKKIVLPQWIWNVISYLIWIPIPLRYLPWSLRTALWRISLVVNGGFVFSLNKIEKVIPSAHHSYVEGFRYSYASWHRT